MQGSDVEIGGGGVGAVQVEAVLAAEEEDAQHEAEAAHATGNSEVDSKSVGTSPPGMDA
jgi:hypothetical protein